MNKKFKALSIFLVFFVFSNFINSAEKIEKYKFDEYLRRIEKIVEHREQVPKSIYVKQWNLVIANENNIHQLKFDVEKSKQKYAKRRKAFDTGGVRAKLIAEWEQELGITWPTYNCKNCCRTKSNCKHDLLEAHHIIPLGYNGPNKWWNIFPLTMEEHTGVDGIHSSEEAKAWFRKVSK